MPKCPKGTNRVGSLCVRKPVTNRELKRDAKYVKYLGSKMNGPATMLNSKQGAIICKKKGLRLPTVAEVKRLSSSRSKYVLFMRKAKCHFGGPCLWQTTMGWRCGLWKFSTGRKFAKTRLFGDAASGDTGVFCVKKAK